jgi:hypothetical protein
MPERLLKREWSRKGRAWVGRGGMERYEWTLNVRRKIRVEERQTGKEGNKPQLPKSKILITLLV